MCSSGSAGADSHWGGGTELTLTRESGGGPGGGPWHIALLGCGDDQQCPEAVREAQVGTALGCRCFHGDRGVVAKELYGGPSQGPPGAGIAQVNLQRHLCGQTHKTYERIYRCVCWLWWGTALWGQMIQRVRTAEWARRKEVTVSLNTGTTLKEHSTVQPITITMAAPAPRPAALTSETIDCFPLSKKPLGKNCWINNCNKTPSLMEFAGLHKSTGTFFWFNKQLK